MEGWKQHYSVVLVRQNLSSIWSNLGTAVENCLHAVHSRLTVLLRVTEIILLTGQILAPREEQDRNVGILRRMFSHRIVWHTLRVERGLSRRYIACRTRRIAFEPRTPRQTRHITRIHEKFGA